MAKRIITQEIMIGKSVANELAKAEARPAHFLEAWKDAVSLAGDGFFTISAPSVAAATDINQLRPNYDAVTNGLRVLSDGERLFLIALYQFYNNDDILGYCQAHEVAMPSMPDLAMLDDEHLSVFTRLLHSYSGW